ncbi:universal stress protein [Streptomyces sp. NPDC014748]|uniref:universal stress protein n=1 Tax=unclassified Streptomyces TaxID=2593676 RepID=UPI00146CAE03|nr:universal stress protein [Streptomyces sp. GMY02]NMO33464.1 universal stress protein [Streptomyces sp. GMY02]
MTASPFHRILVGWDASPAARTALATALALAGDSGSVIVRAVLVPSEHTETSGEQNRDLSAQRTWAQERFDQAWQAMPAFTGHVRVDWGENTDVASDLTASAAEHGCDLVVLGRHGEDSRLRARPLGAVVRQVTEQADIPVLVVPAATAGRSSG